MKGGADRCDVVALLAIEYAVPDESVDCRGSRSSNSASHDACVRDADVPGGQSLP
jgi:hypothetical protein